MGAPLCLRACVGAAAAYHTGVRVSRMEPPAAAPSTHSLRPWPSLPPLPPQLWLCGLFALLTAITSINSAGAPLLNFLVDPFLTQLQLSVRALRGPAVQHEPCSAPCSAHQTMGGQGREGACWASYMARPGLTRLQLAWARPWGRCEGLCC